MSVQIGMPTRITSSASEREWDNAIFSILDKRKFIVVGGSENIKGKD
jgi:hypothetical protein